MIARFLALFLALFLAAPDARAVPPSTSPPVTPTQTIGSKLRTLSAAAALGTRLTNTPWTAYSAWAQSTAYAQGQVVTNNGMAWVAAVAGTSAASGSGPTTISNLATTDGTVYWQPLGKSVAIASTNDSKSPTITVSTTDPALGNVWDLHTTTQFQSLARIYGGYYDATQTNWIKPKTFGSPTQCGSAVSLAFYSDDVKVAIQVSPQNPVMTLYIDDRYAATVLYNGSSSQYVKIDWSTISAAAPHKYEMFPFSRYAWATNWGNIETTAAGSIWAPPAENDVRVVFVGDSYSAGSNISPWVPGVGFAQSIGVKLGWRDVWDMSIAGTGYLNPAGTNTTFRQRLSDVTAAAPDVVILMLSGNDGHWNNASYTTSAVATEAALTWTQIRAALPNAIIIQLGVVYSEAHAASDNRPMEVAVAASAATYAASDGKFFFIPGLTNTNPIMTSTYDTSRPNTSANSSALYLGSDSTHPNEFARDAITSRLAREIAARVVRVLP